MKESLSRIFTLTKRNVKEILRDPLSIIFTFGFPLLLEIVFYAIFHKLTDQFQMKYLAPGIVVFAQAFLTLFSGLLISLDKNTSFLTRLYVSKAKSYEFIFGYAFSVFPLSLVQAIFFYLVGGIIDPTIFGVGMIYSILLAGLTSLFFIAFGIMFGSICNEKSIGGVSSIIICGQSVLSGMWFPLDALSGTVKTIMECLPFRNSHLLVQNALLGINNVMDDFLKPFLIVLGYIIVAFVAAILVFRSKMKEK